MNILPQWQPDHSRPGCYVMALGPSEALLRPLPHHPTRYDLTLCYPGSMGAPLGRKHVIANISGETALKRAREHVTRAPTAGPVTEIRA